MDQSSNVHLMWNKHQTTLLSVFDALLDSEKLTDCTISAEGRQLRAHKIILSACSPYFEKLFIENYEKHPIIILQDVKYHAVKALMDFMYRGELNVPQEELGCILKLSESLQIRGLSGSGQVDDVDMQKAGGRRATPRSPETVRSHAASVSFLASGQKEPEEEEQPFSVNSRCSPPLSEEVRPMGIDSAGPAARKYRSINHSVSDQRTGENVFQEVISPDLDSMLDVPSRRQVLPAASNCPGGSVFTSVSHQSVCSELRCSSEEVTAAEKEQFLTPEAVLTDKGSANQSVHQENMPVQTKSEDSDSNMEIVEVLTLDDDEDYSDGGNGANDAEGRRECRDLTYEENVCSRGSDSLQSPFDNEYLTNTTFSAPSSLSPKRFDCSACGKSYLYRRGLARHLKHECGKEPQFQCPRCNKRCARSDQLRSHMSSLRCRMQNSISNFEENG